MAMSGQPAPSAQVALAVAACGAVLTYALRPPATWPGCSPAAALRGNADPEALHRRSGLEGRDDGGRGRGGI